MKLLLLLILSTVGMSTISAQPAKGSITGGIIYENRTALLNAPDCNGSELYLKKKVKAQLATYYKDYPYIAVNFSSFKGQNGYSDKADARKIVYPYKIEMLVFLKRKLVKEGKEKTEYSTWKYDAVYEYATKPGKKCEFYLVPSSQTTLVKREVY
ncbi:MAG: hypothetical protein ABIT05_12725 [Chitinophagaceae bacterium]